MVALARLSIIISLLVSLALIPAGANAQLDEAKLQAYIEDAINSRWELIVNFQNDQLIQNKQYYQVLQITNSVPEDGAKIVPDKLGTAPVYAPAKTAQVFYDAIKLDAAGEPFTLRVDVYDGPKAQGFVLCAFYTANKTQNKRCWNFGEEIERQDKAWQKIQPLKLP